MEILERIMSNQTAQPFRFTRENARDFARLGNDAKRRKREALKKAHAADAIENPLARQAAKLFTVLEKIVDEMRVAGVSKRRELAQTHRLLREDWQVFFGHPNPGSRRNRGKDRQPPPNIEPIQPIETPQETPLN
jgi:hypothetical protein